VPFRHGDWHCRIGMKLRVLGACGSWPGSVSPMWRRSASIAESLSFPQLP
jgi:hypothetical protein